MLREPFGQGSMLQSSPVALCSMMFRAGIVPCSGTPQLHLAGTCSEASAFSAGGTTHAAAALGTSQRSIRHGCQHPLCVLGLPAAVTAFQLWFWLQLLLITHQVTMLGKLALMLDWCMVAQQLSLDLRFVAPLVSHASRYRYKRMHTSPRQQGFE